MYTLLHLRPAAAGLLLAVAFACSSGERARETAPAPEPFPAIPNYEAMRIPPDNPMTPQKVALGKQLYYDQRVSADGSRSCYSCHLKEKGLTDGLATAIGAYETKLTRASPTMWNVGYYGSLYWDGRSPGLEQQVLGAWAGGNMGASGRDGRPNPDDIAARLDQIPGYRQQFEKIFGPGPVTKENVARAVAAFMRTIVSVDSAWIRFQAGDQTALSEAARRGYQVFIEKAKCNSCHDGKLLTDQQFHNVGIGMDAANPDLGRFNVTKVEKDTGAFKTPTLLDISKSAPYFHDGSAATLEEAVDFMLAGGRKNPYLDTANLKPVQLTTAERADLLAFLRSLDVNYNIAEPVLP